MIYGFRGWTSWWLLDLHYNIMQQLFGRFWWELFSEKVSRSAQIWMATIRLPYAGPTTSLKSAKSRHYKRRPLADFRLVVGPAYGSRMVAIQICADRDLWSNIQQRSSLRIPEHMRINIDNCCNKLTANFSFKSLINK